MTPNEILEGIAKSFEKSPNEIIFAVVLILAFVAILILFYIIRVQYEKGKLKETLDERYNTYIRNYALTPEEQNVIRAMAGHMKKPEKRYLLFTNQHVFNHCLMELKKTTSVDKPVIDSLLSKLQFKLFETYHLPRTSKEFLPGKHLMLVFENSQKVKCIVDSQTKESTIVVCDPTRVLPAVGESVMIYTYNAMGIIHFDTIVQDKSGNTLTLAHSDKMDALQRRHFFRKELQMPVYIHSESSPDPPAPSVIHDLSAGGMSVLNPSKKFRKGDDVKITMHGKNTMGFDLYGEVVRTSKRDEIAHIEFGHFTPVQKDNIIRFLNVRKEEK